MFETLLQMMTFAIRVRRRRNCFSSLQLQTAINHWKMRKQKQKIEDEYETILSASKSLPKDRRPTGRHGSLKIGDRIEKFAVQQKWT